MAEISEDAPPSSVAGPGVSGFVARLRGYANSLDREELSIMLALVAMCVVVRLMRLQPIEYYDDEVTRWHFVREWFHANQFQHAHWTHHMARLGLNVPLFFAQALFGRQASTYYVWPVFSFALQVLFVYLTAKRLGGRAAGVVAAVLMSVFPGLDRGASQLLPDAYGSTAMIICGYLLVRYQEADVERRMRWLVGSALAMVWAYEIKESNLLFCPGLGLAVWFCRGRFRDGVVFAAVIVAAIVIETAGFRIFTDYSSRFAIVEESHGIATVPTFWNLFDRYKRLEPSWQLLLCSWLLSAFWLLGSRDKRTLSLLVVPTTFMLLLTFMVRSIHPIVLWTRFFSRYFEPAAGLLVVAVGLFLADVGRRAWAAQLPPKLADWPARLPPAAWVMSVGLLVALGEYIIGGAGIRNAALHETKLISAITNDAYRRNLPIVQAKAKRGELEERRVRPLKAVFGVYLSDKQIVTSSDAKDGKLPEILDSIHDSRRYSYVLHDTGAYRPEQIDEWVERGCALVLTEEKDHLNAAAKVPSLVLKQTEKLPASCKPPGA